MEYMASRLEGRLAAGPQFCRYQPCDSRRAIADLCNLCCDRSFSVCLHAPIAGDISAWSKVYEAQSISVKKPSLYCDMPGCDPWACSPWADRHDIRSRAEDRGAARGDEHAPGRLQ